MNKIIIHNHSSADILSVLMCIKNVVMDGRVSGDGKCYCYATLFPQQGLRVFADVTKAGTDKFMVFDAEPKD